MALHLALILVPSATAYEVPSELKEVAHVYSLGAGEVRCPSRAEWDGTGRRRSAGRTRTSARTTPCSGPSCARGRAVWVVPTFLCGNKPRRAGSHARGLPSSPLAVPAERGEGRVPGSRQLQGRHTATGSDGRTSRGPLSLCAGTATRSGSSPSTEIRRASSRPGNRRRLQDDPPATATHRHASPNRKLRIGLLADARLQSSRARAAHHPGGHG